MASICLGLNVLTTEPQSRMIFRTQTPLYLLEDMPAAITVLTSKLNILAIVLLTTNNFV